MPPITPGGGMGITQRKEGWEDLFAARTRGNVGEGLGSILALSTATDLISFSGGFPDPATFPGPVLAEILGRLIAAGDASAMQYAPTPGLPGPRAFIAERLARLEGRHPEEGEFLITSGAIEALELVSKVLLDPGDLVMVEGPTYLGAIMAFRSYQANVECLPIDHNGLDTEALERRLAGGLVPKLLYTIPDHQNPTGLSLSADRRRALADLARRSGLLLVEDVAYRELGFAGERPPSLWSLAPDTVVQVGTFSKTFFPGVRLGWGVGPAEVVAKLVLAKQNTDQCAGALGQRLLEEYGRQGLLEEQGARGRSLYGRRCSLLMEALEVHMPEGVAWTRPRGGFFCWLTLPDGVDAVKLSVRAMAEGVAFVPGVPFFPDARGRNNLRLAFSRIDDDVIPEGVRRLAALVRRAVKETSTDDRR
jgi:2-aminoadipate transaminase